MANSIQEYYHKISTGQIKASKKIHKQLDKLQHLLDTPEDNYLVHTDLEGSETKEHFVFDETKANRPISFIETFCRHIKGSYAGKPIMLELWQKAIIQSFYGFVSKETGLRKFRKLHLYVGRKNGKTILAACLIIYEMLVGGEAGVECYTAATKREQAKIAWDMARIIIKKSPALASKFDITVNGIYVKPYRDSLFQPVSKESKKLDGLNAHLSHIDELHAITDSNIIDVLWDSTKSRLQPIELITTTMGIERVATFDKVYEYDANVLDGIYTDERLIIFCYELDDENEWKDSSCWIKANPNLGVSQSISSLKEEVQKAINDIANLTNLLAKSFNLRQTNVLSWLKFDELNSEEVYDLEQFRNSTVIGGFDLSRTGDMTAFTTLLFDKQKRKVIAETMYWITNKYYEEAKKKVPFETWVRQGLVRISGEELINYRDVSNYVYENFIKHGWRYQYINYDSYSAQYLIEEFVALGYSRDYVLIATPQGYKTLSVPMQEMAALLKSKELAYQNNPVTKWCLSNVELETDRNGNFMPRKGSYERKIDGAATMLNCFVSYCQYKEYFMQE